MAAGVEVRVPLIDRELIDFAVRIPPSCKQQGKTGKAIFKKAMEPLLPHDVIYRPKSGFGAPLRRWLHRDLRDRMEDALSAESLRSRGLFDPAAVRRLIELDAQGRTDGAYTIFALLCIELWCRLFVDASIPSPVAATSSR
jgi:asparagine synthase (glutamine-hydrolysing)